MQNLKLNLNGFTFIELLVTVAILGIVLVTSTNIFFSVLKSRRKTQNLSEIKQKGNYALAVMSREIRNAKDANCTSSTNLEITKSDGLTTGFNCDISSRKITQDSKDIIADYLENCSFICTSDKPKVVTVNFVLQKGTTGDIMGYSNQEFSTSVSLRTY